MANEVQPRQPVRFGAFEADFQARELRKRGLRIRLQEHPFRLLAILLERPGEVVTREEIQKRLFPEDTFVEFDHSVNTAIQKIRQALGDSATHPRFVETLPRRGYRFVAPVEGILAEQPPPPAKHRRPVLVVVVVAVALLAAAALIAAMVAWFTARRTPKTPLTAVPLTTYPGSELEPSFSPNGEEV
ncbi:MAG: hypothetical protein GY953_44895, partial [bacterium]|nr:hypothetical protein [bacterium]